MNMPVDKIKTRGYWQLRIRPLEYLENRVTKLSLLEDAVRQCSVSLRGWNFPHFNQNNPPSRAQEYVDQATDWDIFVEYWRACRSGQFISICALWGEWRDQSSHWPPPKNWTHGKILGFEDAIFRFAEIYEFSSRWCQALHVGEEIIIENTICHFKGRQLVSDRRPIFPHEDRKSDIDEWSFKKQYGTAALLANPRDLAIEPTIQLFESLHWDFNEIDIKKVQAELRR